MAKVFGIDRLAQQVGEHVAAEVHHRVTTDWRAANGYTTVGTTPIEKLFFYALEARVEFCEGWVSQPPLVLLCQRPGEFAEAVADERCFFDIYVEQQVELGGWRVDFVIHRYNWAMKAEDRGWLHLIVECDGHDFHERTKVQAARDRSRDRAAAIEGLTVLRFTGSELWNDPFGCAGQVLSWFLRAGPR